MWSRGITILLAAITVNTLASSLTLETTLMLLMENLHLTHDTATLIIGGVGFAIALFAIVASRAIDRLTTLWLPLGAAIAAVAFRLIAALILSIDMVGHLLSPGTIAVIVGLCFVLVAALDIVLVAQPLTLYFNGQVERQRRPSSATATGGDDASGALIFGVRYSLINFAVLVGTLSYDVLRTYAPSVTSGNVGAQWLGLSASVVTVSILILAIELVPPPPLKPFSVAPTTTATGTTATSATRALWLKIKAFLLDRNLWRFSVFCLFLLGTSSIFRHIDQTMPPVMQRLFDNKVHFALIQAINPALIIVFAPLLQWLTHRRSGYWVIVGGTLVSSLSLIPLVIAGGAPTHASARWTDYAPYAMFMTAFSLGEALWSARFTKYTLDTAPPDDKAFYVAVSSIPQLIARPFAAWHSAWLVAHYCPSGEHCAPRGLWLTVWLISLSTPVILTVFNRWINPNRRTAILLVE